MFYQAFPSLKEACSAISSFDGVPKTLTAGKSSGDVLIEKETQFNGGLKRKPFSKNKLFEKGGKKMYGTIFQSGLGLDRK